MSTDTTARQAAEAADRADHLDRYAGAALSQRAERIAAALLTDHPAEARRLAAAAVDALTIAPSTATRSREILRSAETIARHHLDAQARAADADYRHRGHAGLVLLDGADTPREAMPLLALEIRARLLDALLSLRAGWHDSAHGERAALVLYGLAEGLEGGLDALAEILAEAGLALEGRDGDDSGRRARQATEHALGDLAMARELLARLEAGEDATEAEQHRRAEAATAREDLDPFAGAEVIAAYTAADAERDGVLWRMPAEVAGPSMPVLLTMAAYRDAVQWERDGGWNDETGRAHDVAMLLRMGPGTAALRSPGRPALLKVLRIPNRTPSGALSASHRATMTRLEVVAEGYSLAGEPCLIVRLEGERD